MESYLEIGKTILVELENELLLGDILAMYPKGNLLELNDVTEVLSGYKYNATQCLPKSLIKSIKVFEGNSGSCSMDKEHQLNLTKKEMLYLMDASTKVVYISQTDYTYHKALEELSKHLELVINVETSEFGRNSKSSVIIVATVESVYIFDMMALGKIFREFKTIFESSSIKKILFRSDKILDNLKFEYDIEVNSIFDIFVAHCLLCRTNNDVKFDEVLQKYLHIPSKLIEKENGLSNAVDKRPMSKELQIYLARRALLQYRLYNYILHEVMLRTFYNEELELSNGWDMKLLVGKV